MSDERAKEFLRGFRHNEEAVRILEQLPRPKSPDEEIAQLVETAGRIGIQITAVDVAAAVRELEGEMRAKTDAAADGLQAIDDDSLEEVAGGVYFFQLDQGYASRNATKRVFGCAEDFTDLDCFRNDACDSYFVKYYDCEGQYYKKGEEYECYFTEYWCLSNFFNSPDPLP